MSNKIIMFEGKPAIDIIIVHTNVSEKDQFVFLGPWDTPEEPDTFLKVSGEPTWEEIAVLAGIFPSKGQARKNGWTGTLRHGFHQRAVGQNAKRKCITVLNFLESEDNNDAT